MINRVSKNSVLIAVAALVFGLFVGFIAGKGQSDSVSFAPSDELAGARYGWVVERFVDGDSFYVRLKSADGVDLLNLNIVYGVRLVGINTPESDECGFDAAKAKFEELVGSDSFNLLSGGTEKLTDKYGRLLRYVDLNGTDVGLTLIEQGLAVAAYDSFDAKPNDSPHARENEYRSADEGSVNKCLTTG
jgi:endonuclease YncB( thermonuclease family)